jgi:hypothetical protein
MDIYTLIIKHTKHTTLAEKQANTNKGQREGQTVCMKQGSARLI